jgi:hypothetical protein
MNEQPDQADYDRVWRAFAVMFIVLFAVVALAVNVADDDEAAVTVATGGDQSSEVTPEQIAAGQEALLLVGCYSGSVDGQYGEQTNQAIRDFQAAAGVQVDGIFGAATLEALESAVATGQIVCSPSSGGDASTDETGGDASTDETGDDASTDETGGDASTDETVSQTATLSSASYSQTFTVMNWDCTGDAGDLAVEGEADGSALVVVATGGVGTLAVQGATEEGTLNGEITSVNKTPGAFTAEGAFGEPNLVTETFDLSGTC